MTDHPDAMCAGAAERIHQFCSWFDLEPPELAFNDPGSILLTDDLIAWCRAQGLCLDWLATGDARGLAAAYRKQHRRLRVSA